MQSACGNLAAQPVMSCFGGNSSPMDITFPAVAPGQFYLLVLVNRNGQSGTITLSQSGGSASFKCCQLDATVQQVRPVCATSGQQGYIQIQPINVTGQIEYSKDGGRLGRAATNSTTLRPVLTIS